MLKGVNKKIIEVNELENKCFYKAILFVRPEAERRRAEELERAANEYAEGVDLLPLSGAAATAERPRAGKRKIGLCLAALAVLIAAAAAALLCLA